MQCSFVLHLFSMAVNFYPHLLLNDHFKMVCLKKKCWLGSCFSIVLLLRNFYIILLVYCPSILSSSFVIFTIFFYEMSQSVILLDEAVLPLNMTFKKLV